MVRRSAALLDEPTCAVVSVPGTRVGLTPLGRHTVRLNLLAEGTTAPLLESATDLTGCPVVVDVCPLIRGPFGVLA
jgi:hypothetical protein